MQAVCIDTDNNEEIECSTATFPGAKMTISCDKYSSPHFGYESVEMNCDSDGEWVGRRPFSCDQGKEIRFRSYFI